MRFIHTADWQIGKPFARIRDPRKRALAQQARVDAIKQISAIIEESGAAFVLVAGDLFDSPSADKATVSAACSAIGRLGVPVIAIPGNHDHGGPGSVWEQEFFRRERAALAPNLTVVSEAAPFECAGAVILPCPLVRRVVVSDPTEWLRSGDVFGALPAGRPRIVLAHGSTEDFMGEADDEDGTTVSSNLIDLSRLPEAEVDYVALGDWHGTIQVGPKAWYPGTPEPDRFPKGTGHDPGNILVVDVERGCVPTVARMRTGRLAWQAASYDLADDSAVGALEGRLVSLTGQRTGEDLLRLTLTGTIGLDASLRLAEIMESLEARLLRLKLDDRTVVGPSDGEVRALTESATDPLIARVAANLLDRASGNGDDAAVARVALRELHVAWRQERGS